MEGTFNVEGVYSGTTTYAASSGSAAVEVDNRTSISGGSYSNTGAITLEDNTLTPGGTAWPYGSHVFVAGWI